MQSKGKCEHNERQHEKNGIKKRTKETWNEGRKTGRMVNKRNIFLILKFIQKLIEDLKQKS